MARDWLKDRGLEDNWVCVVWTNATVHSQHHEGSREEVARRMEQAAEAGGRSFALYRAVPLQVKTVFVF